MCVFYDPLYFSNVLPNNLDIIYRMLKNTKKMELHHLIPGKIYFISFGASTNLVGRFKDMDTCNLLFFDLIHYWNSFETFHKDKSNAWCVKSGAEIREASLPEKHALIKFELENNCI